MSDVYQEAEDDRVDMLHTKLEDINNVSVIISFIAVFTRDESKAFVQLLNNEDENEESSSIPLDTTQEIPLKKLIKHMKENKEFDVEDFAKVVARRKYGNDSYKVSCQVYKISVKYYEMEEIEGSVEGGNEIEKERDIFAKNTDFVVFVGWHGKHAREYTASNILKEYIQLYL
jgi:hypothetical protein